MPSSRAGFGMPRAMIGIWIVMKSGAAESRHRRRVQRAFVAPLFLVLPLRRWLLGTLEFLEHRLRSLGVLIEVPGHGREEHLDLADVGLRHAWSRRTQEPRGQCNRGAVGFDEQI